MMRIAGAFKYQPSLKLNKTSARELLDLNEIDRSFEDVDFCRTVIDYAFEDTDAQVVYGELGEEGDTTKFFLRTVLDEDGELEDVKVYVPKNQGDYPSSREFFRGLNMEEGEESQKVQKVESIAENFKTGEIQIIDVGELIQQQEKQDGESEGEN